MASLGQQLELHRRRCRYGGSRAASGRGCRGRGVRRRAHRDGTRTGCGTTHPGRTALPASRGSASGPRSRRPRPGAATWRYDGPRTAVLVRHHSPVQQHLPEPQQVPSRHRETAVVHRRAQPVADDLGVLLGAHRRPDEVRDQVRHPCAAGPLADPAEHVGLGGAVEEPAPVRRLRTQRLEERVEPPRPARRSSRLSRRSTGRAGGPRRPGRCTPRGNAHRCACRAGAGRSRRHSRCRPARGRSPRRRWSGRAARGRPGSRRRTRRPTW